MYLYRQGGELVTKQLVAASLVRILHADVPYIGLWTAGGHGG